MGFNEISAGVPAEQRALLSKRNFSIRPLSTTGHLSTWRVLILTWLPIVTYAFTLLLCSAANFRYNNGSLVALLYYAGLALALLVPLVAAGLIVAGILSTRSHSRVRVSAAVYWSWWPVWRLVLCLLAAVVGSHLGNTIWTEQLLPYTRLGRLQAYSNINPRITAGQRLQDAGVVAFNASSGVDRTRAGCLKNGATYCVAPIVLGDDAVKAMGLGTLHGTQDLFMAGVDCCDCPGEFRCGDWNVPMPLGGLRVFDAARHSFYTLAAEDWAATLKTGVGHPIFFEWTADPMAQFEGLGRKGRQNRVLALLAGVGVLVVATLALNAILVLLLRVGWAKPLETPVAPPGLGQAMRSHFMPHMHYHHQRNADELSGLLSAGGDPKYLIL